jgi:hypothetical protein
MSDEERPTTKWGTAEDRDAEIIENSRFEREAALEAGRGMYRGKPFYLFELRRPAPGENFDAKHVIENMIEQVQLDAGETYGECAEDYPDISQEAGDELEAFLDAWAKKNLVANFYTTEGCPEPELIVPAEVIFDEVDWEKKK